MINQPTYEITHQAIKVLCREIGIVNTLRFIQQFTTGFGNYTQERAALFGDKPLEKVIAEIKQNRGSESKL